MDLALDQLLTTARTDPGLTIQRLGALGRTVMLRRSVDMVRQQVRTERIERSIALGSAANAPKEHNGAEHAISEESLARLEQAVRRSDPEDQLLLRLRLTRQLPWDTIAELLEDQPITDQGARRRFTDALRQRYVRLLTDLRRLME